MTGELPGTPENRLAWALERLHFLGNRVEERERLAWEGPWWHRPEDGDAAACWAGWMGGAWDQRRVFEGLYLEHAERAFRSVLVARRVPSSAAHRAIEGLRESFFYRLMMPDDDGVPGWAELAARTLETAEGGPMEPLVAVLGGSQRRIAAVCASSRGSWRNNRARARRWPHPPGAGPAAGAQARRSGGTPRHPRAHRLRRPPLRLDLGLGGDRPRAPGRHHARPSPHPAHEGTRAWARAHMAGVGSSPLASFSRRQNLLPSLRQAHEGPRVDTLKAVCRSYPRLLSDLYAISCALMIERLSLFQSGWQCRRGLNGSQDLFSFASVTCISVSCTRDVPHGAHMFRPPRVWRKLRSS